MDGLFGRNNHGNRKQFFRQQPGKGLGWERPGLFLGFHCPAGHSSVVRQSAKPRLAVSENAFQEFCTRNKTALSTEQKITQGISGVLKEFPDARAGLPSSQPTAVAQTELLSRLKIDFHAITRPATLAGRLAYSVQNCSLISSDWDVLAAVVGYKLEFTMTPIQTGLPPILHFSKSDSAKIDAEIQSLQQEGALKQVGPVSKQSLSSSQTGRDFTPCDQSQGFKQFSPIHSFQNGGYPSPARSGSTGGLAGQNRPEGCIFCSTDLEGSPEVSSFSLEGHTSGIYLSPVWSSSRTEIVHQNFETRRCLA